jgi:hypothetical protein
MAKREIMKKANDPPESPFTNQLKGLRSKERAKIRLGNWHFESPAG